MTKFHYYSGNKQHAISFVNVQQVLNRPAPRQARRAALGLATTHDFSVGVQVAVHAQRRRLSVRFHEVSETSMRIQSKGKGNTCVIATESGCVLGRSVL